MTGGGRVCGAVVGGSCQGQQRLPDVCAAVCAVICLRSPVWVLHAGPSIPVRGLQPASRLWAIGCGVPACDHAVTGVDLPLDTKQPVCINTAGQEEGQWGSMADQPPSHEDSNLQASTSCLRLQRGACESKAECMLSRVLCFTDSGHPHHPWAAGTAETQSDPARGCCCCKVPLMSRWSRRVGLLSCPLPHLVTGSLSSCCLEAPEGSSSSTASRLDAPIPLPSV